MDFSKIKLIIWDLDNTFWDGLLSEPPVIMIHNNLQLLKDTTDAGVMNSICSKNDYAITEKYLKELGVWDCFVFPSIDWSPKGKRIQNIIKDMAFRSVNVLFIDDNATNLEEAMYYNPGLVTTQPDLLPDLITYFSRAEKKDVRHERLNQYRVLEKRASDQQTFLSNEDFLVRCNIHVSIQDDCANQIQRIHELLMRSNQLNYTKIRLSIEELRSTLNDNNYRCGYVSVVDNYGDYGIVGFFALTCGNLKHFVFSCRTLGMGVEQYVYARLGFPRIEIVGEVSSALDDHSIPLWINNNNALNSKEQKAAQIRKKILIKGPCDLLQIFSFIKRSSNIDTEFTYVSPKNGVEIEGYNHTYQIVEALNISDASKTQIINEIPFGDDKMFDTKLKDNGYEYVFISLVTDSNLGVYQRIETGEYVCFGESAYSLTDPANWEGYTSGKIYNGNLKLNSEILVSFAQKYCFKGRIKTEQIIDNLKEIKAHIGNATLVLMLGSEMEFNKKTPASYKDRHTIHREVNTAVKSWSTIENNVRSICYSDYIHSQNDYIDTINHFPKKVYQDIAKAVVGIVNEEGDSTIELKEKSYYLIAQLQRCRTIVLNLLSAFLKKIGLFEKLRSRYHNIKR